MPVALWGFLFLVPSLFLLGAGVLAWIAASQNRSPTTVTFDEFVRKRPHSGWYSVTGAGVDLERSVYWVNNGVCVDVYAPMVRSSVGFGGNVPFGSRAGGDFYVEIDDPQSLSAMQDLTYALKKGKGAAAEYIRQHWDTFHQSRTVSGLVSEGRRDPMGEWSKLGLEPASIVFIADGWKPNLTLAYGGTLAGALAAALCAWLMISGLRSKR